ncbi:MFS transporter [Luteococcus peritonei]|uniref:MFS transporter n=1 Tax=Luteococcus peritonei TaxID=88874 RepID=A0ABW4RVL8_9ACTN
MTTTPTPRAGAEHSLLSAGGLAFLVAAALGRLPSSMVQLGYLMVLSQDGRGLAIGGLAVAAVGLGTAAGAPLVGRLVDRLGPIPAVAGATLVSLAAQTVFLLLLMAHAPSHWLLAAGFVVGAANPQIGPVARSHWSHLAARLRAPHLVSRALGYEGAVDEAGFVVGPVLAGALVSMLGPVPSAIAILALTAGLQGLFVLYLLRHRDDWRRQPSTEQERAHSSLGYGVLLPMLGCLGVGILFGATQTGLTALFNLRGTPGVTGLVYGCVGVGSGLASLLAGRLGERVAVPLRVFSGALLMALGALALGMLPGAAPASVVAVVMGSGAGITLVSCFAWMERIAPRDRMATMMTVLATCLTLGVSGGAAVAGRLAADPSHSFWPVHGSAMLALLAAVGMWLSSRRN